jgi:hypothetical protein
VEQQVVAGRVDVPLRSLQDQVYGTLGDAGRVALVVPKGLGVEAVEAEEGGEEEEGEEEEVGG